MSSLNLKGIKPMKLKRITNFSINIDKSKALSYQMTYTAPNEDPCVLGCFRSHRLARWSMYFFYVLSYFVSPSKI